MYDTFLAIRQQNKQLSKFSPNSTKTSAHLHLQQTHGRTFGQTLQSWSLRTICYAVCHVCRCCSWARYVTVLWSMMLRHRSECYAVSHVCHCCSSMPIPVKWTSKRSDIFHNLKAWCRPTKHHKFSQKWNNCPYKQWYVCRRCSSMPIPVKSPYNRFDILHNLVGAPT